jgi:NADH-quinone oxidoreductase subunit J
MQVLVYAGAIMVVFLFVIMLLNLGHPAELADARGLWWKLAAGAVGIGLLARILVLTKVKIPEALALPEGTLAQQVATEGAIAPLAGPLFHEYLLAFEVTSILLLAAVVGAVVLGKRKERVHAR